VNALDVAACVCANGRCGRVRTRQYWSMSDDGDDRGGRLDVTVIRDVVYAEPDGVTLRADLFLPETASLSPAIIWVHGGGWRFGSRRVAPDLSRFFASRGFAMVAVDYRLTSRATFPAQIEDLKTAIRWVRHEAATHGIDPDRIGLWGASAGGHLSSLAGLTDDATFTPDGAIYADHSSEVQAVVDGYGPIDFLQMDAHRPPPGTVSDDPETLALPRPDMRSADRDSYESLLMGAPIESCPDRVRDANPITYAHHGAPPFLILHGLSDTTIAAHQSELLYDALAAHGNDVTLCLIEGLGHGFLNRSHLDDGPPRRIRVRTLQPGDAEQQTGCTQPIFPLIEAFFRRALGAEC
jgi:acetyl esterase/lipase